MRRNLTATCSSERQPSLMNDVAGLRTGKNRFYEQEQHRVYSCRDPETRPGGVRRSPHRAASAAVAATASRRRRRCCCCV